MNLNYNSVSARLYRWFYITNDMPNSLCPYFWKLVLMWILITPYTILSLPYLLVYGKNYDSGSFVEKPVSGIFMYFALFLALSTIFSVSALWIVFPKESILFDIQILGIFTWLITFILSLYGGILWIIEKYKNSKITYDEHGYPSLNYSKVKESNIFVEWIKSTYYNYCPRINWTFKDKNL
jgi:hypothetical protein